MTVFFFLCICIKLFAPTSEYVKKKVMDCLSGDNNLPDSAGVGESFREDDRCGVDLSCRFGDVCNGSGIICTGKEG